MVTAHVAERWTIEPEDLSSNPSELFLLFRTSVENMTDDWRPKNVVQASSLGSLMLIVNEFLEQV